MYMLIIMRQFERRNDDICQDFILVIILAIIFRKLSKLFLRVSISYQ